MTRTPRRLVPAMLAAAAAAAAIPLFVPATASAIDNNKFGNCLVEQLKAADYLQTDSEERLTTCCKLAGGVLIEYGENGDKPKGTLECVDYDFDADPRHSGVTPPDNGDLTTPPSLPTDRKAGPNP